MFDSGLRGSEVEDWWTGLERIDEIVQAKLEALAIHLLTAGFMQMEEVASKLWHLNSL